ncbi:hypothetical protein DAQ1742_03715 [Dickeya aquatica]|uniref:Uncharacterized protein n=1 Tax=Dickeya aquatica TaxID=1401087 RepID=A0A375AFW5_9GAMM|nr:hypothetical protein DAQ1742_03170 [Dickeya aquatica]SLM64509.1 hypothetical protein DAQ1742_03715 [Dickeya aquatica]
MRDLFIDAFLLGMTVGFVAGLLVAEWMYRHDIQILMRLQ